MSQRKRRAHKPRSNRTPERIDPQAKVMVKAVSAMVEILTCPVLVAEDHADRTRRMAVDVETFEELARIAHELHAGAEHALATELEDLLLDFATTMRRHRSELLDLATRFERLDDHERPHGHRELDDIPVEAVATAMFGEPDDQGPSDDIPF